MVLSSVCFLFFLFVFIFISSLQPAESKMKEMGCQTDAVDYEALLQKAGRKVDKYKFANDLMYQQVSGTRLSPPLFSPHH